MWQIDLTNIFTATALSWSSYKLTLWYILQPWNKISFIKETLTSFENIIILFYLSKRFFYSFYFPFTLLTGITSTFLYLEVSGLEPEKYLDSYRVISGNWHFSFVYYSGCKNLWNLKSSVICFYFDIWLLKLPKKAFSAKLRCLEKMSYFQI